MIDALRDTEGAAVTICCDNPDPEDAERQNKIMVTADWTGWMEAEFYGSSVLEALRLALKTSITSRVEGCEE